MMDLKTIKRYFSEILFGIEKDGEVFEICELPYMHFPYKSVDFIPKYEQYFKGVKIALFFFPFCRDDPTKEVSDWLIDEIIDWSKSRGLIINDSSNTSIVLDGTYWSLGRPAGTFVWHLHRKYKDDIIVRNCDWQILPTPLDSYYFDAD